MDLMDRVQEFENRKMSSMSTSDRVSTSREAKALILELNEVYKQNKETEIMDTMKRLTVIKRKVEKRLKGRMPEMRD
jgi:predicted  nucleic acid-binding Zn-ribbon protein